MARQLKMMVVQNFSVRFGLVKSKNFG